MAQPGVRYSGRLRHMLCKERKNANVNLTRLALWEESNGDTPS